MSSSGKKVDEETPWFINAFGGKMDETYIKYMSEEWGFEKRGDVPLFEKLCLEGAQSGLSWHTILKKRENYRQAFHGFDIDKCAAMTETHVSKLMQDTGIVRHRGKIESVINNAKCIKALYEEENVDEGTHGKFDALIWNFVDNKPQLNEYKSFKEMPSQTPISIAMSKELKRRGFKFVGPTTCYSLMQSCGLVIDHLYDTPEWRAARDRIEARYTHDPEVQMPPSKKQKKSYGIQGS
mmetsp:Transcript_5366/g.7893  ORF Transcript_5366/g.7893 Transcript_5366/m.7893 type:complete len:238 (-) Transcript_5366:182-895(-)